jgi:hypothetical protein
MKDPFSLFIYLVETGGKVLVTSNEGNGPFIRHGYEVDLFLKDLRMLSRPVESLDAVWWSQAEESYSIEDAFRILQIFFRSLKPKKGILALSFSMADKKNGWNERTLLTLFRQSGFQFFQSFANGTERLYFAQRL